MIKIVYLLKNNDFDFNSTGHANYNEYGKDIVCSAVSSIIIGALNAIENIDNFDVTIKSGEVKVKSKKEISSHDIVVIQTMIIQLQTVENEFKDNLKITRRE